MNRTFRLLAVLALSLFACTSDAADLPTCAVMTFEPGGGVSKDEVKALADGLESELIDLKRYKLVSRSNLTKVLEVQKISMECSGTECAIEAGKLAAIQYVVFGSIGKVGKTYSLVANLVNVETGVIEKTAKVIQSGEIDQLLIAGVAQAAKKLMGLSVEESAPPVPLVAIPSIVEHKTGETMTVDLGGGEKLELVWIEPGSFMMGSPASEADRSNDEGQHRVTLTKGFWMGKYEVTQGQWERVMGDNPSNFKRGARNPVEYMNWWECQGFINKLNALTPGGGFRFPTEAEWEYACRAGTTGAYAGSLDELGWYGEDWGRGHHPVGQKKPNDWGLYDMHGNVLEWCQDWKRDYPTGSVTDPTDPTGPGSGSDRVARGGHWYYPDGFCRSAYRVGIGPGGRGIYLGLRLVRSPLEP